MKINNVVKRSIRGWDSKDLKFASFTEKGEFSFPPLPLVK